VPIASKAWVQQHGKIQSVADFAHQELVHTASRPQAWRDWLAAYGVELDAAATGPEFGHFIFLCVQHKSKEGLLWYPMYCWMVIRDVMIWRFCCRRISHLWPVLAAIIF